MATFEELDNDVKEFDKQETSLSLSSAIKKSPEQSAKVYSLSKEKSLPFDYVERNYDKVAMPSADDALPNVAQLLRDREKAAVVHDDVDNLNWWETAAQEAGNIGKTALSGLFSISAAGYSVLGSTANAFSELSLFPSRALGLASEEDLQNSGADIYGSIGKYLMGIASGERDQADYAFPKKTVINQAVLGGIKSVVMNAPAMAAGIVSRNPNVALGAIGASTYGDSYLTAKNAGLSEAAAIGYASNQAIAEVVTESIPIGKLFKDIGGNAGLFQTIAHQMATEIPSEQVATVWQDAIDWAVLHPEKTLAEFAAERPSAAMDTLISTIVAAGIQTGAIAGLAKVGRTKESNQIQIIADQANLSKVNARSPEIFSQHVQDVAESYGAPDNVYIDAKEAKPLLQTMVKDSAYDLISAQINEAEAVGGDIVIPMGEFASKIATSKNFELLKSSVRLAPDSPTNSQISDQPEKITALLDEASKNVEMKTRADQIYQEVSKQLINSGRMNADMAKVNATLVPAFITTQAARSGLSVDDVYQMMGLKIEGAESQSKSALAQSTLAMAEKDPVLKGYLALSSQDEAFKLPKSDSKTIEGVFSDLEGDKGIKLTRFPVMDTGETKVWKVNPDSKTIGMIFEDPKNVWVDVSNLKQGQGGQRIYNAVANYAHNSGKTFIGDPASLSDVGVSRRLENMLNSALKFGTTKHLAPHPRQEKGTDDVAALNWKAGDDKNNIMEMLKASFKATKKQFPEIENLVYDGNTDKFIDKSSGNEFTRDDFTALASSKRANETGAKSKITAGRTTLERAVLTNTLLSTKGAEQAAVLDRLGNVKPERLGGVLYQSKVDQTETPAFKKWFGDSKVVNKDGSPQINYHGSNEERTEITPGYDEPGAWFTTNEMNASSYARGVDAVVHHVYLSIKNPLDVDFSDYNRGSIEIDGRDFDDNISIVKYAERKGYDGVHFKVGNFTESDETWVAFRSEQIKSATDNDGNFSSDESSILRQEEKGSFDPKTNIIKLGEASDLSTFVHELGHSFLEMEGRLFSHPNATPEMKADGKVILDWLGLDSFEQLKDFEKNDASREAHEKFARGFEKYLGEGKAPSIELKSVFRRFSAWMKQVYRDLRNLNVDLNDNIRAVMDRMLATDEQINRNNNAFDPLFKDAKDAGMTEAEFKAYSMESSPDSAKEVLLAKMVKQLKREYTKWWKDESIVVAEQVRKEIAKQPLYSALEFMRASGTTKEAKALAEDIEQLEEQLRKITRGNVTVKQAIARAGGINRKEAIDSGIDHEIVKAKFVSKGNSLFPAKGGMSFDGIAELLNQEGYSLDENGALDFVSSALTNDRFLNQDIEAQAENLRSEISEKSAHLDGFGANRLSREDVDVHFFGDIPGRFIGLTSKNGIPADDMAALHGFSSGSDLIDQINIEPSLNQKVKEQTRIEMVKRHGDILTDGTVEEEAAQAIRNPEHAKKLMAELGALSRKTKTPAIDREAIKAYAKETIGKMAYSKIRPAQYRSAEVRAAREAAIAKNKGDFEAAHKAKQQEIINFYLSREATAAKDLGDKIRASQKAIQTRKYSSSNIDMDHVNQAKILLSAYDFRKNSPQEAALSEANIARVRHWIESQQKDPNTIATFVQAEILGKLIPYKEMTIDDLVGLNDTVNSILHAGRGMAEENKIEYRKNINEGNQYIKDNRIETYETEIDSSIPWVQVKNLFNEATASLRKLDSLARQADGMNDQGWVWRNTVKPLLDAANQKLIRQAKAHNELNEIFNGFNNAFSNINDIQTFATDSGKKIRMSYGARISMALNMGNEGNMEALKTMQSLPLTDNDLNKITSTLSAEDWQLVQKIWDYIDTYWSEISALEIKRSGVSPQKVSGTPFVNSLGQKMKGGYYPLAGDASADIKQLEQDVDTAAAAMMNGGAASKSTKHGSTIERVGFGGKKIDFSLNVLFNHIDGVIHDITHWQAVKDVDRILKNEKINSELAISLSKPGVKAMKQRLKEVAAGPQRLEGLGWVNRILRHARMASTYSALGYSVRTAIMNTMGLTTAIADMNPKQVAKGAIEYYSNMNEMNDFILSKSPYMVNRGSVLNRDIANIRAHLHGDNALTKFREYAFWLMTQTDKSITRPIWLAAYREGEGKFKTEQEAIDHADRMVARTQGSGMDLDLANVETRNELMKTMTVMYSAFSAIYNISTEQIKRYKSGKISGTNLALRMAWLTVIPGIITQLITGSGDDEPDEKAKEYALEIGGQILGMIPLLRDAYSYARYGSSFPTPILRLLTAPIKLVKQIEQGEVDKGLVAAATELASWAHIPGGAQFTRTYGYLTDMQDEEISEFSPIDLLVTGKK